MKTINDIVFDCLKPKLEYICSKIQNSLENVTEETKELYSEDIESYAKVIHELLKYVEGKEQSSSKEPFTQYFQAIIDQIRHLVAKEGKKIKVLNIKEGVDANEQFKKCEQLCKSVKNRLESVVTTSVPGEERIYWPYKNIQFSIRGGNQRTIN